MINNEILNPPINGDQVVFSTESTSSLDSVNYDVLNLLNQSFIQTDSQGSITWANKYSQEVLHVMIGDNIKLYFKEEKKITESKSLITTHKTKFKYLVEKINLSTSSKNLSLYSFVIVPKRKNSLLVRQSNQSNVHDLLEEQISKNIHLFSLIGITVNLDIKSEHTVHSLNGFIAQTIENILFSIYLIFKDKPIKHRHLSISFTKKLHRNHLYFQIPNDDFKEDELGKRAQYRNNVEGTIAEVIKKNELLLADLNGRTVIYTTTDDKNKSSVNFYLSFDEVSHFLNHSENN